MANVIRDITILSCCCFIFAVAQQSECEIPHGGFPWFQHDTGNTAPDLAKLVTSAYHQGSFVASYDESSTNSLVRAKIRIEGSTFRPMNNMLCSLNEYPTLCAGLDASNKYLVMYRYNRGRPGYHEYKKNSNNWAYMIVDGQPHRLFLDMEGMKVGVKPCGMNFDIEKGN